MESKDSVNWEKVDEVALALLSLTLIEDRVWKGLDWDIMDRLHEKGWISNPRSKAKSVAVTQEGQERAREFFKKHFMSDA
ncbi:MAG: hypothetical protein GXP49_01325 [Deltaproteobacteria bacterium]|nr:hypothetical protein [Deltaproteobacteria bacterium]